jgi:hypothetical protein
MAAVAAIAIVAWWPRGMSVRVEGAELAQNGDLAPRARSAVARFGDGSEIVLAASARARIAEVTATGARIVLEQGAAHARIVHRAGTRWSIEAGPHSVRVTGTEFDVTWSPDRRELRVAMQHGAVVVSGPLAQGGIDVRAGQELIATDASLRIDMIETKAPAATSASAVPPVATATASAAKTAAIDPPRQSWAQRVAAGDFALVVAEAEARGVDSVLSSGSIDELSALADAARYAGRSDLAKRVLQAQRKRFAGSEAARTAAFLLARMADAGGALDEAITLYAQYLAGGGGTLAAEALGRKMLAERRAGRAVDARASAEQYLRHYPKGPHAAAAAELSEAAPK